MNEINYSDLGNLVYQRLKRMILNQEIKPGEKIVQEKIAATLGVSRTPLLKALQMLEHELLVESIPRKGMIVRKITKKQIIDGFDCRMAIEGLAARLVAKQATSKQVKDLQKLFSPFEDKTATIDTEKYNHADRTFHKKIIELSNNHILARMEMLGNVLLMTFQTGLVRKAEETIDEHLAIIKAIESGDEDLAEQEARLHITKSRDLLEHLIIEEN